MQRILLQRLLLKFFIYSDENILCRIEEIRITFSKDFLFAVCTLVYYLSGLVCSCQNPTTCPSSCTTIPNLSQFFPIDIAWGWLLLVNNVDPPASTDIEYYYLRSVPSLPHKTTAATRALGEDCKQ